MLFPGPVLLDEAGDIRITLVACDGAVVAATDTGPDLITGPLCCGASCRGGGGNS